MPRPRLVLVAAIAAVVLVAATAIVTIVVHAWRGAACEPAAPGTTRVAAVGDSITAWDGASAILDTTWVQTLPGDGVTFTGGWARAGARTSQMAGAVTGPLCADALVIMAGTNDIAWGDPMPQTLDDVRTIGRNARVPTVVVSAIAPITGLGSAAKALDAGLRDRAAENGWRYVDPWAPYRAADGGWKDADLTLDGVHPVPDVERAVGAALRRAVLDGVGGEGQATRPATRFTSSATMTVPKTYERSACTCPTRRYADAPRSVSET